MITEAIVKELRAGDTVAVTDARWHPDTRVVGTLATDYLGALRLGEEGVEGQTIFSRIVIGRANGSPTRWNRERTIELVEIGSRDLGRVGRPVSNINEAGLRELLVWLGGEYAKKVAGLPSEWEQGSWLGLRLDYNGEPIVDETIGACGTTACAAGHVAMKAGARYVINKPGNGQVGASVLTKDDLPYWSTSQVIRPDTGQVDGVSNYAREVLGLDAGQAEVLFSGSNSFDSMAGYIGSLLEEVKTAREALPTRKARLEAAIDAAKPVVVPEPEPEPEPEPFDYTRAYAKGDRVVIDGEVYEARIDAPCSSSAQTVKDDSSTRDAGSACWRQLGPVGGVVPVPSSEPVAFLRGRTYRSGDRVTFDGKVYEVRDGARCDGMGDPTDHTVCWKLVPETVSSSSF